MMTHSPSGPPLPATARAVLVTGAARRLGRIVALDLARNGWDVAVHCHHSRDEAEATAHDIRDLGRSAVVLSADLADEAACRALVAQAAAGLGRLDAVVNSASRFEFDDATRFGHASFMSHLLTNTAAPVLLAQALHAHLGQMPDASARDGVSHEDPSAARRRPGVVVNLLDQKLWNPNPDFLSYTLSKAALEAATTLLAQALAPALRVAGVAPGLTLTSPWLQGPDFEAAHRLSPLGRSSTPQDVAAAVRFVLETDSITGTTLLVDGGQHLMRFARDFSMMADARAVATPSTTASAGEEPPCP